MTEFYITKMYHQQNSCQSNPCVRNSTCQAGFTFKGYRCICLAGYQGDRCETGTRALSDKFCYAHGYFKKFYLSEAGRGIGAPTTLLVVQQLGLWAIYLSNARPRVKYSLKIFSVIFGNSCYDYNLQRHKGN